MIDLAIQFVVSMIATISFAILFNAKKSDLFFCGISGAIGWVVYVILLNAMGIPVIANGIGTLALTVFSRTCAAIRRTPVTVYLIAGIFPLVPGAGIYYTIYYLILDNPHLMSEYAMSTLSALAAIVLGISLTMLLPQSWFNKLNKD